MEVMLPFLYGWKIWHSRSRTVRQSLNLGSLSHPQTILYAEPDSCPSFSFILSFAILQRLPRFVKVPEERALSLTLVPTFLGTTGACEIAATSELAFLLSAFLFFLRVRLKLGWFLGDSLSVCIHGLVLRVVHEGDTLRMMFSNFDGT
jgi:hypothetical protein